MRTITKQQLIDANRRAYTARRLVAQNLHLIPQGDPCVYQGPRSTVCGIGAVLTDDELAKIVERGLNEGTSAEDLTAYNVVQFEDIKFANDLQGAHDAWAVGHRSDREYDPEVDADPAHEYRTLIGL